MPRITGRDLNEKWKVGAKHALYHRDGTWYECLEKFPGALFDPHGYILFKWVFTMRRISACPNLSTIGVKLTCPLQSPPYLHKLTASCPHRLLQQAVHSGARTDSKKLHRRPDHRPGPQMLGERFES